MISFNILAKKKEQEEDNSLVTEQPRNSTSIGASDTPDSYLTASPRLNPDSDQNVSVEVSGEETSSDDYI